MSTKFKAGKYYIGDPCYIFGKSWDKILKETDYFQPDGEHNVLGHLCMIGGTAYGDGTYTDTFDREYAVDAGLIGILPIELIYVDNKVTLAEIKKSSQMHFVEFKKDFTAECADGYFRFDNIEIDTAGEENDDDDEWESDYFGNKDEDDDDEQ